MRAELEKITDQQVALTAKKANQEEKLAKLYRTMGKLVDAALPTFEENPIVARLSRRLHKARQH
jgi:hypothetical protein